ncbi:helix-turn-helix domain-containing protein [Arenibacter palladensis]|uniref:helix-turn-helix domain-containing protein n=1 Tax=Arenibacter palladensis TaxID=237373 RepID=UPI002FD43BD4
MDHITQLHSISPAQLKETFTSILDERIKDLKKNFTPREPEEFLTRGETAKLLKISLVTIHEWNKKKILNPRKIGNRTYYLRSEIKELLLNSNK